MFDLEQVIRERHSTRLFLPQPVPRALVEEALVLAQHAPSNSDIQPWHMVFASGPPRDRLVKALLEEAQRRPPRSRLCPRPFGTIAASWAPKSTGRWESPARTRRAMMPPSCATGNSSASSGRHRLHAPGPGPGGRPECGMYLQTLLLALTARGLGFASRSRSRGIPRSSGRSWRSRRNCRSCAAHPPAGQGIPDLKALKSSR